MEIKLIKRIKFGNAFGVVAEITGDDDYPTGGYPLTANQLGLNVIENVQVNNPTTGRFWEYDYDNEKIKVLTAIGTQAANESDQSGKKTRLTAIGW